jgi:hypothetical protein
MHFVVASAEQKWWGGLRLGLVRDHGRARPAGLVATTCLGCGRPLALLADPAAEPPSRTSPTSWSPAARWWDDVVRTCSTIRLACDPATRGARGGGGLPTMWRLGKVWYGTGCTTTTAAHPGGGGRRLRELGLTGPFWDLGAPAVPAGTGRAG